MMKLIKLLLLKVLVSIQPLKLETRYDRKATIKKVVLDDREYPLKGSLESKQHMSWTLDGKYIKQLNGVGYKHVYDLKGLENASLQTLFRLFL